MSRMEAFFKRGIFPCAGRACRPAAAKRARNNAAKLNSGATVVSIVRRGESAIRSERLRHIFRGNGTLEG